MNLKIVLWICLSGCIQAEQSTWSKTNFSKNVGFPNGNAEAVYNSVVKVEEQYDLETSYDMHSMSGGVYLQAVDYRMVTV